MKRNIMNISKSQTNKIVSLVWKQYQNNYKKETNPTATLTQNDLYHYPTDSNHVKGHITLYQVLK